MRKNVIIIITALIFLSGAISSALAQENPYVEVVVGKAPDDSGWYWDVSPSGDKLIYRAVNSRQQTILFVETGEQFTFVEDCFSIWLDNTHFYCYPDQVYALQTDPYEVVPVSIQQTVASEVNLESLLEEAIQIHAIVDWKHLWLIRADLPPYLISEVETIDKVIDDYPQTQTRLFADDEKIASPNQQYYYRVRAETLAIYRAADDELMAEFVTNKAILEKFSLIGWAADSSGVYFSTSYTKFVHRISNQMILKLAIPLSVTSLDGPRWRCPSFGGLACFRDLHDITMLNEHEGWATHTNGDHQFVLHYTATATTLTPTWQFSSPAALPTPQTYQTETETVYLDRNGNGWAVGRSGQIWQIVDHEWQAVDSPTDEDLNDLFMLSADEGWAVGDKATILHYRNQQWSLIELPLDDRPRLRPNLHAIHMLNRDEGWAVGNSIFHYQDGEWQAVPDTRHYSTLFAVDMVNPDEGWAVGHKGTMLHYHQGQWQPVERVTDNTLQAIDLVDASQGWAVGENSTLVQYHDGEWFPFNQGQALEGWTLSDMAMLDSGEMWLVNGHDNTLRHRRESGLWQTAIPGRTKPLEVIDMVSPTEGWAMGRSAFVGYSFSGWQGPLEFEGVSTGVIDLDTVSYTEGWLITEDTQEIVHYKDWETQPFEQPQGQWNDLEMLNPKQGWAVGQAGVMAHYQNGQWQVIPPVTDQNLQAVSLVDPATGWAIGEEVVLRYQDDVWQEVAAPIEDITLRVVAALSSEEVWLMGTQQVNRFDTGVALHYHNGSWQVVDIPIAYPAALKLLNEREGWAVGDGIIQFTDAP